MRFKGRAHKVGDDVNTDLIISGRYKFKTLDDKELAKHVLEDLDPEFYKKIGGGDFIVAGRNFGCGSSREQAPLAIKYAGISAVIAESFARIFYRNSINIGLPAIECNGADEIGGGDLLEVDLEVGVIEDKTIDKKLNVKPMPDFMLRILGDGGLAAHFRKHGGFRLD
ncbi:MAG: 3-isopropylmalate dehydratase small subunit [Candidatus Altiarchaeota archaeon]|nr:3-isopropylmalate dehydratase small subunit [Candidatus Altiarchaeota archaeon]